MMEEIPVAKANIRVHLQLNLTCAYTCTFLVGAPAILSRTLLSLVLANEYGYTGGVGNVWRNEYAVEKGESEKEREPLA